jgi:hypothetical protein
MKIDAEVIGEAEVKAAFNNLASRVETDTQAATKTAAIVASKAGSLAPVRTGALASSYGVEDVYVISSVSYAVYIEYGAPARGMAPQYIVQQAFDTSAEQIEQVYSQWIASEAKSVGLEATSG